MRKLAKKLVIYAVSAAISLSAQPVLAYHTPHASADQTTVTQQPAGIEVTADGSQRATIEVQVKNENGQSLPGADVKLTSSRGAMDVIIPAIAYSDQAGRATFYITSGHPGTATFTATVTGDVVIANRAEIRFASVLYGPYSNVMANPKAQYANGRDVIQLKALIKDVSGTPLENWSIVITSNRPEDQISPALVVTNRDGVAYFNIKTTKDGTPNLDVKAEGEYVWAEPINFVKVPVDSYMSRADVSHVRSLADGTSAIRVTVETRGNDGFALPSRRVEVTSNRGFIDTITPSFTYTDADGLASVDLRSNEAGTTHLSVHADGVRLAAPDVMFMTAPSPEAIASPGLSEVQPAQALAPADGATPVRVIVVAKNSQGLPLTGKYVSLASSRGSADEFTAVINPTASRPDAPAAAIYEVRSARAGTATIHAVVSGVGLVQTARITFTPAPLAVRSQAPVEPRFPVLPDTHVSGSASLVSGAPASVAADNDAAATVTVAVKNSAGEVLAGKSVVLASSRMESDTITPNTRAVTNANGVATFTVTSKSPGASTFTAIADGVYVRDEASVLFALPTSREPLRVGDVFRGKTHATVYFYGRDGKKYAFPNEKIYFTWYDSFAPVKVVPDSVAAAVPSSVHVVHPRPGSRLLQFVDLARDRRSYVVKSANVYVMEPNGALRLLASPEIAEALYGPDWELLIVPSLPGMNGYHYREEITSTLDFNREGVASLVTTINDDLGI